MPSEQLLEHAPAPARSAGSAPAQPVPLGGGEQLPQLRCRLTSWKCLGLLHEASSLERVRKCRKVRIGQGPVEIRYRCEENRAHTAGLQTCGSVWACPLCSERILVGRADELLTAIDTHAASGGDVLFVTLTMRHKRGQALDLLWDALGEAWRAATSKNKAQRDAIDGAAWTRRVEVTHGVNGWHVHIHALLFVSAGTDPGPVGEAMFNGWRARLVSQGLEAPSDQRGMTIKRLDLTDANAAVAEYLAKTTDSRKLAAHELASTAKVARAGNRTPMQILADCVRFGEAQDFLLWREWEKASHGRRALTWSRGARDRLVGDAEKTDEQLAQETDQGGEIVCLIEPDAWKAIVKRPKLVCHVLQRVELEWRMVDADVYQSVWELLDREGLGDAVCRPPPAGGRS